MYVRYALVGSDRHHTTIHKRILAILLIPVQPLDRALHVLGEPCEHPPNPTFIRVCPETPPVHCKTGRVLYVHQEEEGVGQEGIFAPSPSIISPIPTSHSAIPLASFPEQHDSISVPCGKPKGLERCYRTMLET